MLLKITIAGLMVLFLSAFQVGRDADASSTYMSVWAQSCGANGGVDVTLTWTEPGIASPQYVDISSVNNGWQLGTFSGSGALPPGTTWMTATGLMPNAVYFARITQPTLGNFWDQSPTFYFLTSASCSKIFAIPTLKVEEPPPAAPGQAPNSSGSASSTGPTENCHPDYFNACIDPNAKRGDYSCSDFPEPVYLTKPGVDPLGLDTNGDGIACE